MIGEFLVYVIIDDLGIEIDRFFHEDDAEEALSHYCFHCRNKRFTIIHRTVIYSDLGT